MIENDATARLEPLAISIPEAVRLSGLGRSTLYNHIADGTLETRKMGKRRIVIFQSLKKLLQA